MFNFTSIRPSFLDKGVFLAPLIIQSDDLLASLLGSQMEWEGIRKGEKLQMREKSYEKAHGTYVCERNLQEEK